jgi:DNA invertase Pin-like site-specific DNA recombinase
MQVLAYLRVSSSQQGAYFCLHTAQKEGLIKAVYPEALVVYEEASGRAK